jgi:hypothetical protein
MGAQQGENEWVLVTHISNTLVSLDLFSSNGFA